LRLSQVGGQGLPQASYRHSQTGSAEPEPEPEPDPETNPVPVTVPNPGLYDSHITGQTSSFLQVTHTPAAAQAYAHDFY